MTDDRADADRGRRPAGRSRIVALIAFAVAAAAVATAATIAFVGNHDDVAKNAGGPARLDDPAAFAAYVDAASSAIAVVTSYDYRHLDDALRAGLAVTTGAYQRAYRSSFAALRAAAIDDHVVQSFEQLRIGVGDVSAHGRQAQVLVYGTEHRTSTAGSTAEDVTLRATLVHRGGTYLIGDLDEDANAGLPPGSAGLRVAAEAGRSEVIAVNSYRRAHFETDLRHALDGAAGSLRTLLSDSAATTRAAMTKGHYDLSGAVTAVAVERSTRNEVVLLMAATGIRIAAGGTRSREDAVRFEVTVDRSRGRWLTTALTAIRSGG